MVSQHAIHHRPGGFDRVLAGEQSPVPRHRIGKKPLVGALLVWLFIEQVELALVAYESLVSTLDTGR